MHLEAWFRGNLLLHQQHSLLSLLCLASPLESEGDTFQFLFTFVTSGCLKKDFCSYSLSNKIPIRCAAYRGAVQLLEGSRLSTEGPRLWFS